MSEIRETEKYIINRIYNCQKLLSLYRDDENIIMAKVECIHCGNQKNMRARQLNNSKTNSCKCRLIKHNLTKSKLYSVYHNMKDRCYNSKCHAYKDYGQVGIKRCDLWLGDNGFINFYQWAINNGYNEGLTIDRIEEDGIYEPRNCQWITLNENVAKANKINNRHHNKNGDYFGISPLGIRYEFENAAQFSREMNLLADKVRNSAKYNKPYKNWIFGYVQGELNEI